MYLRFRDRLIYFETLGNKGDWIVFLHGWQCSIESFKTTAEKFTENKCLLIDLPPFGNSEEMVEVWNLHDYVEMLIRVLEFLKIERVKIIGHSFGGRVAILFTSLYNNMVEKLILVSSAGIKPKRKIKIKLKILKYKLLKKMGFKQSKVGSIDYRFLSDKMKGTFVNIVNKHLESYCKKIICPTIIIFGENDMETPLYMAKKLNLFIKNSATIIFKNAGHFPFVDNFYDFILISKNFFK